MYKASAGSAASESTKCTVSGPLALRRPVRTFSVSRHSSTPGVYRRIGLSSICWCWEKSPVLADHGIVPGTYQVFENCMASRRGACTSVQSQELFLTSCVHRKQNQRMNEGRIEVVDSSTMRVVLPILWVSSWKFLKAGAHSSRGWQTVRCTLHCTRGPIILAYC